MICYTEYMSFLPDADRSVVVAWNAFITNHSAFGLLVKLVALYAVYLIPIIWVGWWFVAGKRQRELLLSSILTGVLAWQVVARIIKLFVFHSRPIQSLPIKELFFHRPENSFPSDHAAFLSSIAFFFLLRKQRRPAVWLLLLALLTGLARIAVAVHYPSDIVAGWFEGFLIAVVIHCFHDGLLVTVWDKVIALARRLHLA